MFSSGAASFSGRLLHSWFSTACDRSSSLAVIWTLGHVLTPSLNDPFRQVGKVLRGPVVVLGLDFLYVLLTFSCGLQARLSLAFFVFLPISRCTGLVVIP